MPPSPPASQLLVAIAKTAKETAGAITKTAKVTAGVIIKKTTGDAMAGPDGTMFILAGLGVVLTCLFTGMFLRCRAAPKARKFRKLALDSIAEQGGHGDEDEEEEASVVGTPHSPRRSAKAGRKAKKSHAHPDLDGERFLNVRKGRRSAEDLELAQNVLGDSEEESDGSEAESDGSGEESASDASVSKRDGHVEVGGRRLQMND